MKAVDQTNMQKPTITNPTEAISITKENGTKVGYFLFDKFEVHTNVIPGGCVQDWHIHNKIEEIIIINEGTLLLEWIDAGVMKQKVKTGEIIRMNNSIHRISNEEKSEAKCTIFRFISPEENQADRIKNDKKIYSDRDIKKLIAASDIKV